MMWPGGADSPAGAGREPSRVSDGAVRRVGAIAPAAAPAAGLLAPLAPPGTVPAPQPNLGPTHKAVLRNGDWKVVMTNARTLADVLGAATASPLPLSSVQKWQFALGQFGSAALVGLVGVQLVSFYLPPIDSATGERLLPVTFVSQGTIWGVFNVVSMTAAVCRLWDAVTDPLVANISDRLASPLGRRIPCMRWGALPACGCCALLFFPPVHAESVWNVAWLAVVQVHRALPAPSPHPPKRPFSSPPPPFLDASTRPLLTPPSPPPTRPSSSCSSPCTARPTAPCSLSSATRPS